MPVVLIPSPTAVIMVVMPSVEVVPEVVPEVVVTANGHGKCHDCHRRRRRGSRFSRVMEFLFCYWCPCETRALGESNSLGSNTGVERFLRLTGKGRRWSEKGSLLCGDFSLRGLIVLGGVRCLYVGVCTCLPAGS